MGCIDIDGQRVYLRTHHLVGRSKSMNTRVASGDVSAQHLALAWTGTGWVARDLASRNGTRLDGEPLTPGVDAPLSAGAVLELGSADAQLRFVDDGPPAILAISGDTVRTGDGVLLALPSEDQPEAVVFRDPAGRWLCSMDSGPRPVEDGQALAVAGQTWTLVLPEGIEGTAAAAPQGASDAPVGLCFAVSADEEYVELSVRVDGRTIPVPPRSYHYLLLTLARTRLEQHHLPEAERGWWYRDQLRDQLKISDNQFYVSLHRARKQLASLDLPASLELFEERRTTRQIRIGTSELEMVPL